MASNKKKTRRKYYVETLKDLASDEWDAEKVALLTNKQIIDGIISCAFYYKIELNNS